MVSQLCTSSARIFLIRLPAPLFAGYKSITNVDISSTVVSQMQAKCDPEKFKGLDCETPSQRPTD